jgi:ketosteroid isomerase-like protein
MTANEKLITRFYTCFQNKDIKGMQECYADNAVFNDEAFSNLNAKQVRAMWEMLISAGKDMKVTFDRVSDNINGGEAHWRAVYTFSRTGNKVVNKVSAVFIIENGKIVHHTDSFDFYKWARQAFGFTGLLLGGTSFFHNKVRKTAMQNLAEYMKRH